MALNTAPAGSPASGLLKSLVKGRTVNVHAHVLSPKWWPANPTRPPGWEATPDERRYAQEARARRKEDQAALEAALSEQKKKEYAARAERLRKAGTLEEQAACYLLEMDEAGLDLMVNHTMDHSEFPGFAGRMYALPFEQVLEECAGLKERFPDRFEMFAGVDPRRGRAGVKLFERAVVEFGALGLGEMVSTQWRTMPNDKKLCYPFYEKAAELGVPLMQDATMDLGFSRPELFEQMARDFPTLKICLGGCGAGVAPVPGPQGLMPAHDTMLMLAETHENVWLDLDDWQRRDLEGIRVFTDFVRRALSGPARRRIMFGSDYPVFANLYTERDWIETVLQEAQNEGPPFSEQDLTLFFSENALRLLGL